MPKALVVDDESTIRAALQRFFVRRGWVCDEAENGRVALEQLTSGESTYDAIVCDIRMPEMSGVEVHDWLEENRPELLDRMLLIAGDTTSQEVADFLRRTSCPLLRKPFELPELGRALEGLKKV